MFCQECGKAMPNDSLFCPECGAIQNSKPVVNPTIMINADENTSNGNEATKFCSNCGCQMPSDSRFCPECRTKQEDTPPTPKVHANNPKPKVTVGHPPTLLSLEESARIAKRNKILAIVLGGILALCVLIGVASALIKPTINLNNYLIVNFEGYDTVGKAVITFNTEKFEVDYEKKLSAKTSKKSFGLSKYINEEAYIEPLFDSFDTSTASSVFLLNCIGGSVDTESGLSNGDVVTYTWDCMDEYALETYGYKLIYTDVEYTVSNLKEAKTFDPFDGIEVLFEGISPNGYASISGNPKAPATQDLRFELDRYDGLKNGDTITLMASGYYNDDPIEYCISNYGMIPSSLTKTITVDGLDSYIRSIEDVSEDSLKLMQSQAEDVFHANVALNWGEDEALKSLTYIGDYLLTSKSSDSYWSSSDNILYLVYKAQVKDKYTKNGQTNSKTNDIYWYIAYYNLLVKPEGETTVEAIYYDTPSDRFAVDSGIIDGWFGTKTWYYNGYQTLDELYKVVVTSNADTYNHEDNVDESVAVTEIEEEEEEEIITFEEGFIFPESSKELLSEIDIEVLSDEELRYAINELYARHGYIFKDDTLREYYEQFDWYEQEVKPDDFSIDLFNDVEKENLELLQKERSSRA